MIIGKRVLNLDIELISVHSKYPIGHFLHSKFADLEYKAGCYRCFPRSSQYGCINYKNNLIPIELRNNRNIRIVFSCNLCNNEIVEFILSPTDVYDIVDKTFDSTEIKKALGVN